jgi:hypothetical protein
MQVMNSCCQQRYNSTHIAWTGALNTWNWQDNAVSVLVRKFDKAWGVDHVLQTIGASDKSIQDGGKVHVLAVAHGDGAEHGGGYGQKPYDKQPAYTVGTMNYPVCLLSCSFVSFC